MDLRKIKKLIELVEESGISELEVRDGDEVIRIARPAQVAPVAAAEAVVVQPTGTESEITRGAASGPPQGSPEGPQENGGFAVTAPLAGTFYRAPAPGERPFVTVGQNVAMGDVLCIIESMKMMNQIEAEQAGRVVQIFFDDGQPIETGQTLFQLV
jgi:acetyl-CoA carboxylase biotin carboxyl carrier protein